MLAVLVLVALCFSFNNAYPDGAPLSACTTMSPNHGTNSTQNLNNSPYSLERNLMQNGETTVTVNNNTAGSTIFRGILLEARTTPNGPAVGSWILPDGGNFQYLSCDQNADSALTHTNRSEKSLPMSFTWLAPSVSMTTNYTFYVTIVENFATFYVMIPSSPITIESSNQEITSTGSLTAASTTIVSNTNATTVSTASTSSTTSTTTMSTASTTSTPTSTTTTATNETTMSTGSTTSTLTSTTTAATNETTMSTASTTSTLTSTTMSTGSTTSTTTTMSTTSAAEYQSYKANNIILALLCCFLVALV